jgi:regulatory protein
VPVIESVETGEDCLKLTFDDGSVLAAGTAYLPPEYTGAFLYTDARFTPGAALDPETETALRRAAECLSAEKAALRLVARAEQCAAGLAIKLEQRRHSHAAVRAVLDRLLKLNLVNDARYAELWLKYRVNRGGRGPRALAAKLRSKGIDRKTVDAAFGAILTPGAEAALLRRRIEAAYRRPQSRSAKTGFAGTAGNKDRNGELRCFLKSEGFSQSAIDAYFEEEENQNPEKSKFSGIGAEA